MVIKRNSVAGLLATDAAGGIYLDLPDGDGPSGVGWLLLFEKSGNVAPFLSSPSPHSCWTTSCSVHVVHCSELPCCPAGFRLTPWQSDTTPAASKPRHYHCHSDTGHVKDGILVPDSTSSLKLLYSQ